MDRRVKRTRRLLRDALLELIVEKGYDAVTVQDITDKADLARATFYLHFKDKEELLFTSMSEIYANLLENLEPVEGDAYAEAGVSMANPADFEHVAQYAPFYKVMLGEHGSMAFIVQMRAFLAEVMQQRILIPLYGDNPPFPLDFMAHYLAGAQIGMIAWWLENDMPHSAEEMAQMGHDFAISGLR